MKKRQSALKAEQVENLLGQCNGNMAAVARALEVSRSTVKRFVDKRPSLVEVVQDLREGMKDNAESALYNAVLAGEAWAVCFFLKTQGRDRGYVERQEVKHSGAGGGGAHQHEAVVIYVPSDGRDPPSIPDNGRDPP
jgi:hypothetical protein